MKTFPGNKFREPRMYGRTGKTVLVDTYWDVPDGDWVVIGIEKTRDVGLHSVSETSAYCPPS